MATFSIENFGCRATEADAAALRHGLLASGLTLAEDHARADVVVLNTCTVTSAADSQTREAVRKIHRANPGARIVVTGCYAQRAPEEIAALDGVAWVIGNSHQTEIPGIVRSLTESHLINVLRQGMPFYPENRRAAAPKSLQSSGVSTPEVGRPANRNIYGSGSSPVTASHSAATNFVPLTRLAPLHGNGDGNDGEMSIAHGPAKILTGDIFAQTTVQIAPSAVVEGDRTRPILKIQDGCNNRCSYCVIPFVRGRSRSLSPDTVIEEVRNLVTAGAREIVLSGINLGAYGRDLTPRAALIDVVQRILDETSLDRLRFSSIEPQDVTEEIIALVGSSDRLARHFHVPLQSGADRILRAMHRWYRAEHYAERIKLIRHILPDAAIGADIIVGFPGETAEDFQTTVDFIERLPFSYLHVFSFSARPGTKGADLEGAVPTITIRERARTLRALAQKKSAAFRASQAGRTLRALTLARGGADGTEALTGNYLKVRIAGHHPANQWHDARIPADTLSADSTIPSATLTVFNVSPGLM